MDFTLSAYKQLISTLRFQGYFFQTFEEYIQNPKEEKVVILRHDVDRLPGNALVIAEIEKEAGIRASYYFRTKPCSYDENVIKQIAEMGHEIGYHYENLAEVSKKNPHHRGIRSAVTSEFHRAGITQIDAERKRRISHRRTQTHTDVYPADFAGQKWSSLREKTEIRGQMSEVRRARARDRDPQISQIDADYLISHRPTQTDTDICPADVAGQKESSLREKKGVRDELFELAIGDFERNLEKFRKLYPVKTICMHGSPLSRWDNRDLWKRYDYRDFGIIAEPYFDLDFDEVFYITDAGRAWNDENVSIRDKVKSKFEYRINSTDDIIDLVKSGDGPDKIMLSTHPHNWAENNLEWFKILVWQNMKNVVKRAMLAYWNKR